MCIRDSTYIFHQTYVPEQYINPNYPNLEYYSSIYDRFKEDYHIHMNDEHFEEVNEIVFPTPSKVAKVSVSYTHLDVYKRQWQAIDFRPALERSLAFKDFDNDDSAIKLIYPEAWKDLKPTLNITGTSVEMCIRDRANYRKRSLHR